jgi:hypothetical protein
VKTDTGINILADIGNFLPTLGKDGYPATGRMKDGEKGGYPDTGGKSYFNQFINRLVPATILTAW